MYAELRLPVPATMVLLLNISENWKAIPELTDVSLEVLYLLFVAASGTRLKVNQIINETQSCICESE